ncbi:MAG: PEP/pyruvate-binding domain-containing protein [Pseudomonadales bacterium]
MSDITGSMLNSSNNAVPISTQTIPRVADLGGKAASLVRLKQAGFNVPDGYILDVNFFQAWNQQVVSSAEWRNLLDAPTTDLSGFAQLCDQLKVFAANLAFTNDQLERIKGSSIEGQIYAVRSSSPEEDLADSSFAGLYETILNVEADGLIDAIRECYLSCLDARVFIYKHKLGMPFDAPRIAVVIQAQINSDISGVMFSINPLNNDYDEAVINGTFGLGDALVSGEITPDSWTIDKVNSEILDFKLGAKAGDKQSESPCLTDRQLKLITHTICRIEDHYGEPVDVEWAIAQGELYLLQARPITTYIPITQAMMTKPGEPRILYMDENLADAITISGPVSVITNDYAMYLLELLLVFLDNRLSFLSIPQKESLFFSTGIRIYTNMSRMMSWVDVAPLATSKRIVDTTYADILETSDMRPYKKGKVGLWAWLKLIPVILKILWKGRQMIVSFCNAIFRTEKFQRQYHEKLADFDTFLATSAPFDLSIDEFLLHYYIPFIEVSQSTTVPALGLFVLRGTNAIDKLIDDDTAHLIDTIKLGSEDMVMVMGLDLYELSTLLPATAFTDLDKLHQQIVERSIDSKFLDHWDNFLSRFGNRGPLEMDLSRPKYSDDPMLALKQIAGIVKGNQSFDPRIRHKKSQQNRPKAYEKLMGQLPARKKKKLAKAYKSLCDFEHSREIPKDQLVAIQKRIREYLLQLAQTWVEEKRLDRVEQIFELKVEEVLLAQQQPQFDLKQVLANREDYIASAKRVRHFPHAIDSRGRILHPVVEQVPGQLVGTPVSSGVVTGPVKVMHDPFEKEIEQGDILVAHTTDPGWTPLFINAAAILLEVGGELQHGALVAREYGKPCVAGIVNLTRELEDGQLVEVDGNSGRVRILDA